MPVTVVFELLGFVIEGVFGPPKKVHNPTLGAVRELPFSVMVLALHICWSAPAFGRDEVSEYTIVTVSTVGGQPKVEGIEYINLYGEPAEPAFDNMAVLFPTVVIVALPPVQIEALFTVTVGNGFTLTVTDVPAPDKSLLQLGGPTVAILTKLKVVKAVNVLFNEAVPALFKTMV